MKNKLAILVLLLALIPLHSFSQIHYEVIGKFGYSNIHETNWETNEIVANKYSYAPSYSLGFLAVKPVNNIFQIKTGIVFESTATKVSIKEEFDLPEIDYEFGTARYYSMGVPIQFSYAFEKWWDINLGVDNRLLLNRPDNAGYKIYSLNMQGGFDFKLTEKIGIGLIYSRGITSFMRRINKEIYYYADEFNLTLTYVLPFRNQ